MLEIVSTLVQVYIGALLYVSCLLCLMIIVIIPKMSMTVKWQNVYYTKISRNTAGSQYQCTLNLSFQHSSSQYIMLMASF